MSNVLGFPQKNIHRKDITHIARADLIAIVALYYLYIEEDTKSANIMFNIFATQAPYTPAIKLTSDEYALFKKATPHAVDTISAVYEKYLVEANKLT
jgi:hypothetical protein